MKLPATRKRDNRDGNGKTLACRPIACRLLEIQNMNTEISTTTKPTTALGLMASRLSLEPQKLMSVLKSTVFSACRNDEELAALVVVSNEYGLNPLLKEIYAFPAKGGGIVPMIPVDGWVKMINNHPQMDGMEFDIDEDDEGNLYAVTCRIFRKDRTKPIVVTEYLSECKRNTDPWKMEHRMLRHKALMQCARYAFGFSGIHDEDEATDIGMRDVTPTKSAVARETVTEPTRGNAPAAVEMRETAPTAEPEKAPAPTNAKWHPAYIISAEEVEEGQWVIVLKGEKSERTCVADTAEVGEQCAFLAGMNAEVTFVTNGKDVTVTAVRNIEEEEGDLL